MFLTRSILLYSALFDLMVAEADAFSSHRYPTGTRNFEQILSGFLLDTLSK